VDFAEKVNFSQPLNMDEELNEIAVSVLRTVFKHENFKSDLQEKAVKAVIKGE